VRVGAERSVAVPVAADLEVLGAAGVPCRVFSSRGRFPVRLVFVFDVRGLGAIALTLDSKINFGCDPCRAPLGVSNFNALLL